MTGPINQNHSGKPGFTRAFFIILTGILLLGGLMAALSQPPGALAAGTGPGIQQDPILYLPYISRFGTPPGPTPTPGPGTDYVVVAWNDLGMHCYNRDFQDLGVLPPFNTLYAQVILRGDPPQIVTNGLALEFAFPDNTTSVTKTNFWTYAQDLFNLPSALPADQGLTGTGLAGEMEVRGDHFVAEGIPLTEFSDSAPNIAAPYQLAEVIARDGIGDVAASLSVVAPVSTEMRCDNCHSDGQQEDIRTGKVETNILTLHDLENSDEYPAGFEGGLMANRPVLCAECHRSNALAPYGVPGQPGIPNLSRAMHAKHSEAFSTPNTGAQCYTCHPGPETQCLRDVMSTAEQMDCVDCHGGLLEVAAKDQPWLEEPSCDSCHTAPEYAQDQALYRESRGHGGLYCAACHDSPHAIAPSREANDGIKFIQLQGSPGPLGDCMVCHLSAPDGTLVHEPGGR